MDKRDPRLTRFTVSPMIQHAIRVLRAAIPQHDLKAEAIGIRAGFDETGLGTIAATYPGRRRGTYFHPTDEQAAAVCLLAAAFGLQQAVIRRAYGIADDNDDDESYPPEYRAAVERLNADARQRARIEGSTFFYFEGHVHGGVDVYL